MKSTHILSTGLGGLIVAASFGLFCLPAKADKIIQINTQTTEQDGYNNTSVQQSSQTAEINKQKIRTKFDRADDYDYLGNSSESSRPERLGRYGKKNTSSDRRIVNPR